ncbi:hypothetical protein RM531_08115 [Salinisphaera sp. P385]|uniref:DUF2283 domain-containing protein n=1 Tax=Spectribacter acetivorans TaxID=3075603 RepID=A0ABU3B7K0_9GAMM|nr:hypothetical protein [Salinisphaera sp. P385]MDT0618439.1 hypothetical protein [Salinisphaera sp. P385]
MYLLIFEDGSIKKARTVSDDDLSSADDGMIQIVGLEDSGPREYVDGEWLSVPLAETDGLGGDDEE